MVQEIDSEKPQSNAQRSFPHLIVDLYTMLTNRERKTVRDLLQNTIGRVKNIQHTRRRSKKASAAEGSSTLDI